MDPYEATRAIPPGRLASYGEIGSECVPRLSGLLVGRRLRTAPSDCPWWRVVGADGRLPIASRDPRLAERQRELLASEGVSPDDGGVYDLVALRRPA